MRFRKRFGGVILQTDGEPLLIDSLAAAGNGLSEVVIQGTRDRSEGSTARFGFETARTIAVQVILAKNWWSLLIRGLAAIAMGVITVVRNAISIDDLTLLFFVYALFDGLVGIAGAVRAGEAHNRWTSLVLEGLTGIAAAAAAITLQPYGAVLPLESVIVAWALATGILDIAAARRLRRHIAGEWLLALGGLSSLVLGILTVALPRANSAGIAARLGMYGFAAGIVLIALGFRLRSWSGKPSGQQPARVWQRTA